jgi:tryptophan-rich sensory protein
LFALFIIIFIWLFIITMIVRFWKVNKLSSLLLIPYLFWVTFASLLNFYIWRLN